MSCKIPGTLFNVNMNERDQIYKLIITNNPDTKRNPESIDDKNGLRIYPNTRLFLGDYLSIFCVPSSFSRWNMKDTITTMDIRLPNVYTRNDEYSFYVKLHNMPAFNNINIEGSFVSPVKRLNNNRFKSWINPNNWIEDIKSISPIERLISINSNFENSVIVTKWSGDVKTILVDMTFGSQINNNNFFYGFLPGENIVNAKNGDIEFGKGYAAIPVPRGSHTLVMWTTSDQVICNSIYIGSLNDLLSLNDVNPVDYPTTITGDYYCDMKSTYPCTTVTLFGVHIDGDGVHISDGTKRVTLPTEPSMLSVETRIDTVSTTTTNVLMNVNGTELSTTINKPFEDMVLSMEYDEKFSNSHEFEYFIDVNDMRISHIKPSMNNMRQETTMSNKFNTMTVSVIDRLLLLSIIVTIVFVLLKTFDSNKTFGY